MSYKETPIKDEFDQAQGQFQNYDAYDTAQRFALARQKHVDIRDFDSVGERVRLTMISFDRMTLDDLSTHTMTDLEEEVILFQPESWSAGDVDIQTDRNNWEGLSLDLAPGINTTKSVLEI